MPALPCALAELFPVAVLTTCCPALFRHTKTWSTSLDTSVMVMRMRTKHASGSSTERWRASKRRSTACAISLPTTAIGCEPGLVVNQVIQRAFAVRGPEVTSMARTGSDEIDYDSTRWNESDGFLGPKMLGRRRERDEAQLAADIRNAMARLPGVTLWFARPIEIHVAELPICGWAPILPTGGSAAPWRLVSNTVRQNR